MAYRKALVLGATGGIGGEVARQLKTNGWEIVALHRDAAKRAGADGFSWRQGDAMARPDVMAAAEGASLIVHAVNPPGYRNWGKLVLPMLDNTIAAARANGARVLLPGTVYNYGLDVFPVIDEVALQNPITAKGRIRAEMERRLREASVTGVRTLIVRAGDFFGPRAGNNWFAQGLIKPGKPLAAISYPGAPGVGHQWAYLPDVAETMLRLIDKEETLEPFATFHMEGHWDADGARMIAAIRQASGRPDLPVRRFPWRLLTVASPFVPLFQELREMRYLWQIPVRLTNARLIGTLGAEPRTPLVAAIRATLADLNCLESAKAQQRPAEEGG